MARIDLETSIAQVEFSPEIWEWLDLLGDMLIATQEEALEKERSFKATTPHLQMLRRFINRDIASLNAIYALLRMEMVYQAAAHIRLFCENVITLRYILQDRDTRSMAFTDYAAVDGYKICSAYLEWESQTAKPEQVEAMRLQQKELEKRFMEVRGQYTFESKGRTRELKNWCKHTLKNQADQCGPEIQKLYAIAYRQLSAYVHGSAWALRRQEAYSRTGYDQTVVLTDFATLTRILLAVWLEWLKIMSEELDWQALRHAQGIVDHCNDLDKKTKDFVANRRNQEKKQVTGSGSDTSSKGPLCVLCDEPAEEGNLSFVLPPEANEVLNEAFPDANFDESLSTYVLCKRCKNLPPEERQNLVQRAIERELES